jgi:hypothetical protein
MVIKVSPYPNWPQSISRPTKSPTTTFPFSEGISGTVTSLACAPHHVGSTSLDRFFRVHETASEGTPKDRKGRTFERVYTKSIPTVVVWDSSYRDKKPTFPEDDEGEGDDVWEDMEDAEEDGEVEGEEDTEDELSVDDSLHKKSRTK